MIKIDAADPEYESAFAAYRNYFEDLAGTIGGRYGWRESLVDGVHHAVFAHARPLQLRRRNVSSDEREAIEKELRRAWRNLSTAHRELEDEEGYDEEANAWLPVQAYYAVYAAIRAYGVASGHPPTKDHLAALAMISRIVERGLLPYPWDSYCTGCPQTGTTHWFGAAQPGDVHVLSSPDPDTSEGRLAMFLRTTRQKELERKFGEARSRDLNPGRSRRNLKVDEKERIAARLPATTLFHTFWRVRKKANYDDADTFVLGAAGSWDARRFADSLCIVTDATVAALEALSAEQIGNEVVGDMAQRYAGRTGAGPDSAVGRRARAWAEQTVSPF